MGIKAYQSTLIALFFVFQLCSVALAAQDTDKAKEQPSKNPRERQQVQEVERARYIQLTSNPMRTMTDAELIFIVRNGKYEGVETYPSSRVIGLHRNNTVISDIICSDICPQNTVRIIRYKVPPRTRCSSIGGVEHEMTVPVGIIILEKFFCFPEPISNSWDEYLEYNGFDGNKNILNSLDYYYYLFPGRP